MAKPIGKYISYNSNLLHVKHFKKLGKQNACYEVFRVMQGKPVFLNDHLNRLYQSLNITGYSTAIKRENIISETNRIIKANNMLQGNLWIEINADGDLCIFQIAHTYPAENDYKTGVLAATINAERPLAHAKQLLVRNSIMQKVTEQDLRENIYDYLLVNKQGLITEGTKTNIFFIKHQTVFTAATQLVLEGITRKKVIDCCRQLNIACREYAVAVSELPQYHAAFFTGTSPKVLPIAKINNVGFNAQAPVLHTIMDAYEKLMSL